MKWPKNIEAMGTVPFYGGFTWQKMIFLVFRIAKRNIMARRRLSTRNANALEPPRWIRNCQSAGIRVQYRVSWDLRVEGSRFQMTCQFFMRNDMRVAFPRHFSPLVFLLRWWVFCIYLLAAELIRNAITVCNLIPKHQFQFQFRFCVRCHDERITWIETLNNKITYVKMWISHTKQMQHFTLKQKNVERLKRQTNIKDKQVARASLPTGGATTLPKNNNGYSKIK